MSAHFVDGDQPHCRNPHEDPAGLFDLPPFTADLASPAAQLRASYGLAALAEGHCPMCPTVRLTAARGCVCCGSLWAVEQTDTGGCWVGVVVGHNVDYLTHAGTGS